MLPYLSLVFTTDYIQTELMHVMTCCLCRRYQNLVLYQENIQFLYIYVSVNNDIIKFSM